MRNTKQHPAPQATELAESPLYEVYDVVALGEPWPEAGLEQGAWGTVLSVRGGPAYEVEFTDRDGSPVAVATVPERILGLVWADNEGY
ncbi:MAG TPA: DUF4926 domain-containing protein [Oscillatoriaceae cyanobacterium]